MITSQTSFLSEILGGQPIPIGKLAYFRARLSNEIHELVLSEFVRLERENKINRAELARRIGRKPEQVTRWLGAPGNWTIETFSDLVLAMGYEPQLSLSPLAERQATEEKPISKFVVIEGAARALGVESHAPTAVASAALPSQEGETNALGAAEPSMPTMSARFPRAPRFQCEEQIGPAFAKRLGLLHTTEARL